MASKSNVSVNDTDKMMYTLQIILIKSKDFSARNIVDKWENLIEIL